MDAPVEAPGDYSAAGVVPVRLGFLELETGGLLMFEDDIQESILLEDS